MLGVSWLLDEPMKLTKSNENFQIFLHKRESKRETNYAKYCINARGQVMWNSFWNDIKNILSQDFFKLKIKEKIFEYGEELSFF